MRDAESPAKPDVGADLDLIVAAATAAGDVALEYFRRDPDVWYKNEGTSPVSEADIAVDRLLRDRLMSARPDYGWLSEESGGAADQLGHETIFVVDPIDGTRGFIAGDTVWCVSIAVVHLGRSVAGVLVAPATGEVFTAHRDGPALCNDRPIAVSNRDESSGEKLNFAAPVRLMERLPGELKAMINIVSRIPSLAYRLAMVADGRLDATLVRESANDWDIAAADIILERAGGLLVQQEGKRLAYGLADSAHGILVAGSPKLLPRLSAALGGLSGH